MADPIDVAKDVSIAFLSASALLLTLILGFISPMHTLNFDVKIFILAATLALYVSAGVSAQSLLPLINLPSNTKNLPITKRGYTIMGSAFLFALGCIVIAILLTFASS